MPGIAISASIVPPLCVTGAALLEGASAAAWGSFLLFVTNYVAIQVAGAAVYLMAGLGRREFSVIEGRARELWYLGVALMALAVVGSLATTSFGIVRANDELRRAQEAASAWVEGTEYRIARFELEDGELRLEIAGAGRAPRAERLARSLSRAGLELDELRSRWWRRSASSSIRAAAAVGAVEGRRAETLRTRIEYPVTERCANICPLIMALH